MYVPAEASREALNMKREATLVSEALQKSLWAFILSFILFFSVTARQHHHVALPSVTVKTYFQTSSLNVQRKSARPEKHLRSATHQVTMVRIRPAAGSRWWLGSSD